MKQQLAPKEVYAITALTIDQQPNEVVKIIRKHGVMLPANPSQKQIETAFGSLLPKSEAFRKDFSNLATNVVSDGFSNANGDDLPSGRGIGSTSTGVNLSNIPNPINVQPKSVTYNTKKSFKDTAFGSFLTSVFTPETIQSGINTGLNVWSIKQTGQPASNIGGDIGMGREQLNQNQPPTRGISTTTMVLIGVGAIALIGLAVYFYKKK
jgi:hypothetical protein